MADASDFDPYSFGSTAEAHEAYQRLRETCPVGRSEHHGGFSVVTRYEDVRAVAAEHELFSSATGVRLPQPDEMRVPPLEMDPPEHTRWRRVFRDLFDAPARRRIEARVGVIADQLIDTFVDQGSCDLVADYAEPLPVLTIAELVGLDAERALLMRDLVMDMFAKNGDEAAFQAAGVAVTTFFLDEVNDRRARPRDDYLTKLGRDDFGGARLTDQEIVSACISVLGGGHHSTVSSLSSLLFHVLSRDDVRARLTEERALVPAAIEETLRLDTALHSFRRRAQTPAAVGDTQLEAGEDVLISFAAANRDPEVFADPHSFDLDRRPNSHVAFGYGIHACVGAPVARIELRVALNRLLDRLPTIRLSVTQPHRVFVGGNLDIITELPAVFPPGG